MCERVISNCNPHIVLIFNYVSILEGVLVFLYASLWVLMKLKSMSKVVTLIARFVIFPLFLAGLGNFLLECILTIKY